MEHCLHVTLPNRKSRETEKVRCEKIIDDKVIIKYCLKENIYIYIYKS